MALINCCAAAAVELLRLRLRGRGWQPGWVGPGAAGRLTISPSAKI